MAVSRQLEKKFLKNIHFWRIYAIFKKGSEKFLFSFDDFPDFFTQFFQSNKKYIYVHLMKKKFIEVLFRYLYQCLIKEKI